MSWSLLACTSTTKADQPDHVINLWPNDPPGEKMDVGPEEAVVGKPGGSTAGQGILRMTNVTIPQAHVYLPPVNVRTGAAVVICPGGGFSILAWDYEGTEVAQWLNRLGIAGIVLKYRVPTRNQDPRWLAPTQDAQRTLSLVRHYASEWGLDEKKIGILGFSAGGSTAFKTAVAPKRYYDLVDDVDQHSCLPNRSILVYPAGLPGTNDGYGGGEDVVNESTPPIFMVHAFDDHIPVEGTANLLLLLKKANVPSELHVYDAGGHGYGLRQRDDLPVTTWIEPCEAWLRRAGWLN